MSNDKKDKLDDKYMTNITLRNDSVVMVGGDKAIYSHDSGEIRIKKGEISLGDFGIKSEEMPEELLLIHEHQHEIDIEEKGIGTQKVSLDEYYQRNYHMEVGALIAEKLEIRRQFMEIESEEDRKKFFKKFESNVENKDYIEALRSGKINPNSVNPKDFTEEMAFIKNSSVEYRCDPNDNGYHESITNNAIVYLLEEGNNVRSNPEGFKEEVRKIYQIGGFDFSSVGKQEFYPMKNNGLDVADGLLRDGADANKVVKFLQESQGMFSISNSSFAKAESFDVTGLSREQAETLLQTVIVAKEDADIIAERICLGDGSQYGLCLTDGNKQVALYLDMKRDIWEKNGTLSENGDEEKFNRLMKEAKTVEIDCEGWLKSVEGILTIAKDPSRKDEFEEVKKRVKENQGKVVNVDDYSTGLILPLDGHSVEGVLEALRKEEEENKKFWEEYYEKHPEEKNKKERLSEPYQKKIMNLASSVLADELKRKKEEENKVENLQDPSKVKTYAPFGDGMMMEVETPKFDKAELKRITNEKGESIEVAMIDGQKHGAEITRDSEGNILDYKLYDHGKEIDLKNRQVDIETKTKDGMNYTAVKLDGQMFGAEVITDANGKTKASFYEQNGVLMAGDNITKSYVEGEFYNKEQLREGIKEQKGELHNSPLMKAQEMRFDMRYGRRFNDNTMNSNESENAENRKSSFTPVWQKDGYDR